MTQSESKIEKKADDFILDYIKLTKTNLKAYATIVKELYNFQKKHEKEYEGITKMLSEPQKMMEITQKLREIDKETYLDALDLMFTASILDNKVRNVFFLSLKEKERLVTKLIEIGGDLEAFLKRTKKRAEKIKEIKK